MRILLLIFSLTLIVISSILFILRWQGVIIIGNSDLQRNIGFLLLILVIAFNMMRIRFLNFQDRRGSHGNDQHQ